MPQRIVATTALIVSLAGAPLYAAAQENLFSELWGAETCHNLSEVLAFDTDNLDLSAAEYAEGLSTMAAAYGFLHGYAVASGWHTWPDFDYVSDFVSECETQPLRPPMMILMHLF